MTGLDFFFNSVLATLKVKIHFVVPMGEGGIEAARARAREKQQIVPLAPIGADARQRASKDASRKMKLILQCVGSLPATPDLADEMNRVESAVDFIAAQEHGDSEKSEILDLAAEAISNSAVAPTGTHLVVRVSGIETMTVTRTVAIVKAIMTASSDSEVSVVIHMRDPECRTRAAQIEVLLVCEHPNCPHRDQQDGERGPTKGRSGGNDGEEEEWGEVCVCVLSLEEKRSALKENLELYPVSGLRFIEEDVLEYIADPDRVTTRIRLLIQALGASQVTEDLADQVQEVIHESETKRHTATASALDFSYLLAIDRDTGTAAMRFQLDADEQIPETLFLIQLVLEACVEAGASLLEIELADGDRSALLSVSPMLSVASTDGCCAGAKLAVIAPRLVTSPTVASPASASASTLTSSATQTSANRPTPHATSSHGDAPKAGQRGHGGEDLGAPESAAWSLAAPSLGACSWFVPDLDAKGTELSILLQALGAVTTRAESKVEVDAARRAARAHTNALSTSDFSFLTDLDEESKSASLTFDVGALGVPLALAKIQIVLQACIEAGAASLYLELVESGSCIAASVTLDVAGTLAIDAKRVPLHSAPAPWAHSSGASPRSCPRWEEAVVSSSSASRTWSGSGSESEASQTPTHVQCSAGEEAEKRAPEGGGACRGGGEENGGKETFDHSISSAYTSSSTSVPQADEALGVGGNVAGRGGAGGAAEVTPVERIVAFVGLTPEKMAAQIEDSGDEEVLFGLAHGLLDLKIESPEAEKIRMKIYDETMQFIEAFSPQDRCAQDRTRKLRVLQLNAKRLLLHLQRL